MSLTQQVTDPAAKVSQIQQLANLGGQAFCEKWLELQCNILIGAEFGTLLEFKSSTGLFKPVASWPVSADRLDEISELVEEVIEQESGLITHLDREDKDDNTFGIAYPLRSGDSLRYIVAIIISTDDKRILKYSMQQLEWGCAWLELSDHRLKNDLSESRNREISKSISLLAHVLSEETGDAAALRLVTEIADVFSADRVSIGFIKNKQVRVAQVSHTISFGKRMNIIQCIEAAMNEAVDQHGIISFPPAIDSDTGIVVAHTKLHEATGKSQILTVPLYVNDDVIGAITLERASGKAFTNEETVYCESITAIAVSAVVEKKENDRNIFIKLLHSFHDFISSIFGAGYLVQKLLLMIAIGIVVFFSIATKTYNLSADARLQGEITRAIVAPFDGYIDAAMVRAGDRLAQGDTIVSLDIRDYYLEKLRWSSEIEKLERQRQEAMAGSERAAVNVLGAQLQQAQIQLDMVEMQIDRAVIRAPFAGLVVTGDLSQRLGGAVEKGELLFELSPLDRYRVNLQVRENRIADVKTGQEGSLYLSALPERPFKFTVNRISPVNITEAGQTYFIVEARLHDIEPELQVGMEGIGQIRIDERKIISIWTMDLIDWLRLQFWSLPI